VRAVRLEAIARRRNAVAVLGGVDKS
jgi:hypothetical protein